MNRQQVYKEIDKERDYQLQKWGEDGESKEIESYLLYMEHYLLLARGWVTQGKRLESLGELRKVTALGIACFESNGIPSRVVK